MKDLTPFDSETLLMMENVSGHTTKVEKRRTGFSVYMSIAGLDSAHKKAVAEAVEGRWGRRLVTLKMFDEKLSCKVTYAMDSDKMPREIRGDYTSPSDDDAPRYVSIVKYVRAMRVDRDNLDALMRFTGGGSMTIPKRPYDVAYYEFPDDKGIIRRAKEGDIILRDAAGQYTMMAEALFRQCYVMVSDNDEDEQRIMRLMDVMYGRNLSERLAKLSEEYGELQEAAGKISMHGSMSDEDKINVVDEVSDMCAVLGHIVHILGFDFTEMLLRAESKISGRIDNPDYMRRHPHTEDNN